MGVFEVSIPVVLEGVVVLLNPLSLGRLCPVWPDGFVLAKSLPLRLDMGFVCCRQFLSFERELGGKPLGVPPRGARRVSLARSRGLVG